MSLPLELSHYQRGERGGERPDLSTLEKQLMCPICLDVFTKPVVILPCQHNLCRKCANELYQPSLFQVGSGGRFRCPSCRHEVILDRHGVYGLQRNLLVENIIDVYKQESASSRPPPKIPVPLTCEDHEGEKLNIYCITCNVPTCSLCKVFGAHKSCQVAPLPDVYQQQKTELNDGIDSLVARNDQVQGVINELEDTCQSVEDNSKTQKQTLCEKFDRLSTILEERRKIMTQRITYEQDEKTNHTRSVACNYREQVDSNRKLLETALRTMEEPDMSIFVQNAKGLIEQVNEAAGAFVIETLEPGYENMDHYKVNFNAEERALYQLDFLKVEEEEEVEYEEEEEEYEEEEVPEELEEEEPEPESEEEVEAEYEAEYEAESEPIPEPEEELEPEPEPVPETEPEREYEATPAYEETTEPEPEPVLELKTNGWAVKDSVEENRETVRGQAEGCSDPQMDELLCKHEYEGISTQQDKQACWHEQRDAGDLGPQSVPAEASQDAMLYPSWYKPNSWQQVSSPSCMTLASEPMQQARPDFPPPVVRDPTPSLHPQPQPQPQFQQSFPLPAWMGSGFMPMAPEIPASQFGRVASETPQYRLSTQHQAGDGAPDGKEHPANQGAGTVAFSPQAITFLFYFLALMVILPRVWGPIQYIFCT